MPEVNEVIKDNTARVRKVFLVADINNSTKMKQVESEQSWVPKTVKFYELVAEHVAEAGGKIVKFVGDGALAVFEQDDATNCINAAI